jgi:hypothetical protein
MTGLDVICGDVSCGHSNTSDDLRLGARSARFSPCLVDTLGRVSILDCAVSALPAILVQRGSHPGHQPYGGAPLAGLGIEIDMVRQTIASVLGRNERIIIQQIIHTSRVKKVIEISFEEAEERGLIDRAVGSPGEHLIVANLAALLNTLSVRLLIPLRRPTLG